MSRFQTQAGALSFLGIWKIQREGGWSKGVETKTPGQAARIRHFHICTEKWWVWRGTWGMGFQSWGPQVLTGKGGTPVRSCILSTHIHILEP